MNKLKTLAMGIATAAIAAMPFVTQAAETVQIESTTKVANVTAGDTAYHESVNAKVDEVVKVQVWYHNKENEDSGKIANNLKVKIAVPNAPGKVQTVTGTVSADNSNTVVDTATVNLSLDNARLEYIPGSATWRHNTGTNAQPNWVTETISDQVVGGGVVLENAKPCFNFEANVTILMRVKASGVSIVKQVRVSGSRDFVVENTARPGETLDYVLIVKNEGNTVLDEVQVGDNLPPYLTYVPGSTKLVNSGTGTGGRMLADGITTGGITIDDMNPGSTQYVSFKAKLADTIPCGNHRLRNVGIVRAKDINQIFNTAYTNVNLVCVQTPPPPPPVTPPPVQPPLPETGMEGAAAAALGTGALGYSVRRYRLSKRSLIDALKR